MLGGGALWAHQVQVVIDNINTFAQAVGNTKQEFVAPAITLNTQLKEQFTAMLVKPPLITRQTSRYASLRWACRRSWYWHAMSTSDDYADKVAQIKEPFETQISYRAW